MITLLATLLLIAQDPKPQARIVGQVIDAAGAPLPAAEVWVTSFGDAHVLARGRTDGEGRYQLQVAAAEAVMVHATAAGRLVAFTRDDPRWPATNPRAIQLWEGTTVRGRVTDASGQPVAGAIVAVGPTRRTILLLDVVEARTAADGRYELEHAPLGAVGISAWAAGHVLTDRTVWIGRGGDEDLAFTATAPRTATIRVGGLPAAETASGWRVLAQQSRGAERVFPLALLGGVLDAEGQFLVSGLPIDASFQIDVLDPQRKWFCKMSHLSERGADLVELQAQPAEQVTWKATLIDPAGAPIAGERVRLTLGDTVAVVVTPASGEVSISGPCGPDPLYDSQLVDSTSWTLDPMRLERARALRARVAPGDATLGARPRPEQLHAKPAASVGGRVLGVEGKPLADAAVILEGWVKNRVPKWVPLRTTRTDREGRFRIAGVPSGSELVRLRIPDAHSFVPIGPLKGGEEISLGDVTATPAGTIEGVILGASGKPVPGARVFLVQAAQEGWDQAELLAGSDGRFRFAPAATGTWQCSVQWATNPDLEKLGPAFEVAPGKSAVHEFRSTRD